MPSIYKAVCGVDVRTSAKKKEIIADIMEDIEKFGFKNLILNLKVADAQEICETLKVDFEVFAYSPHPE